MRIIKHGKDPLSAKPHRVKCRNCKTVFEFTASEAVVRPDWRDGDYYEIACPVCKRAVTKAIDRGIYNL